MKKISLMLMGLFFVFLGGCATIPIKALPPGEPDWNPKALTASKELDLIVRDTSGKMSAEDLKEMTELIQKALEEQGKQIKTGAEDALTITFLEFEKGSYLLRFFVGFGTGISTISALVILEKNQEEISRGVALRRIGCTIWEKGCLTFPQFRTFSCLKRSIAYAIVE